MPDQKPPRVTGDERDTLLALLQYQRDSFIRKVIGLDEGAARQQLVPSGTSLLWLLKHMARAEVTWMLFRFAGEDVTIPVDTVQPGDTLTSAVNAYCATWPRVDAVVAATPSLDEPCRRADDQPPVSLR